MQRYGAFFPDLLASLNKIYGPVDLFLHQWEGPYTAEQITSKCGTNPVRALKIEPRREFEIDPRWYADPRDTPIYNVVSMCYGIQEANRLRHAYEDQTGERYYLVIRARSDIRLHNLPPDPAWARSFPERTICLGVRPNYLKIYPVAVQDQIAIGRPEDMDRYARLYENLPKYYAENPSNMYHPETYFGWSLRNSGLTFNESGFSPELERAYLHPRDRASY
jgi:hypothetical protein